MTQQLTRQFSSRFTVADSFQMFLLDRKVQRLSERTIDFYEDQLLPFIDWCAGHGAEGLEAVSPTLIRAYLAGRQDANVSDHTVHAAARSLRAFFNFCVSEELLAASPMRKVNMPKVAKRILPAFVIEDVERLLKASVTSRERAVVLCLLDTGCRVQEFVSLNGGDIDLAQGVVHVRHGKGGKDRVTFLGSKARKALFRYYAERGAPATEEPVWVSEQGATRLTDNGMRQLLRRLGRRAGVSHCHPHTFRRTFALWSLRNGMSLYHLQRLMGHADIAVLRQYLALVEADLQGAHAEYGAVDNMLR